VLALELLNRLRCHTISMDVSPKALELGEELFRLDPRQRLDLAPRFLAYDGRRFPLADESVDRIVCFDAFHHVPNEDEILAEMFRVLRRGGRVVFAEPGEGHSHAGSSLLEAQRFQVLENELDLRALPSKAKRLGFTDLLGKPYPDAVAVTLSADEYFRFMDGDDRFYPWDTVRRSLRSFYVFVLLKGPESFDSRNPKVLRAARRGRRTAGRPSRGGRPGGGAAQRRRHGLAARGAAGRGIRETGRASRERAPRAGGLGTSSARGCRARSPPARR
jgi:SAM-dependent methyltransferase